jgi:hypothetical protein
VTLFGVKISTVSPVQVYEEYVTSAEALLMPKVPNSTIAAANGAALRRRTVSAIERTHFLPIMASSYAVTDLRRP